MDTETCKLLRAVLTMMVSVQMSAAEDHFDIKVHPGQNAMLQCQGQGGTIGVLQWIRADLKSDDGRVFFYREQRLVESYQHPSFRGRVELMDPEMKDGNASVILKNVTINDTGTYECHVKTKAVGRSQRDAPECLSTINLKVEESGPKAGNTAGGKYTHGHVGVILSVTALIVIVLVGLVIKKSKGCLEKNSDVPGVEAGEQCLP
ncbi:coxsackievirus and adenovirus receptor-like isoform X2 [Thunnus maccoyii]|uniref:coxsackievirus and adenovirus receptor-like isoform X2 n=1 Tax=Thunnus maccoyii TaxID=8240 RepID=UPI001C4BF86B|nr:coxsackievirus and adenovirus receptor-like isoform X2 [Thunnus maccoyii]